MNLPLQAGQLTVHRKSLSTLHGGCLKKSFIQRRNLCEKLAYGNLRCCLSTPTFNVEILPNALAALPELFAGLDDVLPALDVQLEETWSGEEGPATEVLITANIEQALVDSRPIFLVDPKPDAHQVGQPLGHRASGRDGCPKGRVKATG